MSRLFINDKELDLPKGYKIARTKQVNDITSLKNRQSNFSQSIQLPWSKKNIIALEYLGFNGDSTSMPYQLNNATLINDSGESEVKNGRLVIVETIQEKYYKVVLYDGYIDFIKEIENTSIISVGLSELSHLKNVDNVLETWNNDLPYRYNVADYNGNMTFYYNGINHLNVDYLIPSVKKSFLFDKIFEYAGWSYEGDIFDSEDWLNNYVTYPKAIGDSSQQIIDVCTWNFTGTRVYYAGPFGPYFTDTYKGSHAMNSEPLVNNIYVESLPSAGEYPPPDGVYTRVKQTGLYKFTFDGSMYLEANDPYQGNLFVVMETTDEDGNAIFIDLLQDYEAQTQLNPADNYIYVNMVIDQEFTIQVYSEFGYRLSVNKRVGGSVDLNLSIVEGDAVDFEEALIDLEIKDFLDEVLWEFSLTPFTDSANKKIKFLSSEKWLNNSEREDWSSDKNRFVKKVSEKYIFGSYAQLNYFTHKYNEDNANYNDGALKVYNTNLKDKADLIKSKFYTVERDKTYLIDTNVDVYKLWNKEVKDDGTVQYKELQNRFYNQRTELRNTNIYIGSEKQNIATSTNVWYIATHTNFKWKDLIANRYGSYYSILSTQRIVIAEVYFNQTQFKHLRFDTLKFIKELGSYFIVNKVPNFVEDDSYKIELLEVDLGVSESYNDIPFPPSITLASNVIEPTPPDEIWILNNDITFNNYLPTSATIQAVQYDANPFSGGIATGFTMSAALDVTLENQTTQLTPPTSSIDYHGWYVITVTDNNGLVSNSQYLFLGDFDSQVNEPEILFYIYDADFVNLNGTAQATISLNNFIDAPTFVTFQFQKYDFISQQPIGGIQVIALPLTINEAYVIELDFGINGYYKCQILTNTINSDITSHFIF